MLSSNSNLALVLVFIYYQTINVFSWGWQWEQYAPKSAGQFFGTAPQCDGQCSADYPYLWFNGLTEGDGNLCTAGDKVYCNVKPNPWANTVWKGTAPFCGASCDDCAPGYCIATDQAGDGAACLSGRKALCGVTGPPQFRRLLDGDDSYDNDNVKLIDVPDIEMGFMFKSNGDDKILISKDNEEIFKKSVIQFLNDVNLYGTDIDMCSIVKQELVDPYTFLVNIKFNFDTLTNAEKVNKFLKGSNKREISASIHVILKSLEVEYGSYDNIKIEFIESGLDSKYVMNDGELNGGYGDKPKPYRW